MNWESLKLEDDLLIFFFGFIALLLIGIISLVFRSIIFRQSIEKTLSRKLKNGEFKEVVNLSRTYIEKKSNRSRHDNLYVLYYLAQAYEALNDPASALKFYTDASVLALKNHKLHGNILLHIAKIYEKMGKNREALSFYITLAEEDPHGAESLYELARFQYNSKNLKKSREVLERLLKKRPGLLEARFLYGKIFYETSQFASAIKQFELLSKYDYENFDVFYYRAKCMENLKKYTDAVREFQYILSRDWEDSAEFGLQKMLESVRIAVINLYFKLKDYHSGINYVSEYLAKPASDETKLELIYLYANLLWNTGEEYQALKNFERIFLMKADYKDAAIMVDRFKKILPHPYLSSYFTSIEDTGPRGFETECRKILGRSSFNMMYRNVDYYIYSKGVFYIIFYRHIEPIPFSKLTDIEVVLNSFPVKPQNIEIYSLSGIREDSVTHYLLKTARLVEGNEFLSAVKKTSVKQEAVI